MRNSQMKSEKKPVMADTVKKGIIYRSHSMAPIEKLDLFRIEWFCEERREPIGPYEHFIESYRGRSIGDEYVAQCFTKDEIKMLRTYLWRTYSWSLSSSKNTCPLLKIILRMNKAGEFSIVNAANELRYVELSSQASYDLPFKVRGYGYKI
jgi:hypothetical protein